MQSKTSLWAFSYVVFGWILLRVLLNMPDFSSESKQEVKAHIALKAPAQLRISAFRKEADPTPRFLATASLQEPRALKMAVPTQQENRQAPRLNQRSAPPVTLTIGFEPAAPRSETLPAHLGTIGNHREDQNVSLRRLSVSGWLLLRPQGSGSNIATAGQLAGSQAGIRLTTQLTKLNNSLRLTGFARTSSALIPVEAGEAAIGVSVKHSGRLASEILVERRIKLTDGGRSDFALVGSTSVYDLPITPLVTLEGYAQAGVVGLKRRDLFVDASLRVNRRLMKAKSSELLVGAGIWGTAQPSVHRVDVGPQMTFKQHITGGSFRVSGEWRFRLRGNARPNSGPTVTAGFDF